MIHSLESVKFAGSRALEVADRKEDLQFFTKSFMARFIFCRKYTDHFNLTSAGIGF